MNSFSPSAGAWRRIAVVSDIHGNLPALQAVAAEIDAAGVDAVLNLGDLLSGPLWPTETAAWLRARGWPTIAGNHERQLLHLPPARQSASDAYAAHRLGPAERAWLAGLPAQARWCDGAIVACHGRPGNDLEYLLETPVPGYRRGGASGVREATDAELRERLAGLRAPLLLCGHSHQPRWRRLDGMGLLNPGSVGLPAFDDTHGHPHVIETGGPQARWALAWCAAEGVWQAELRATAYDAEAAARQAEAQGRGDWADALRTGRVGRTEAEACAVGTLAPGAKPAAR